MAVVKCGECGGKVSTKATACPHCGVADFRSRGAASKGGPLHTFGMVVIGGAILYALASGEAPTEQELATQAATAEARTAERAERDAARAAKDAEDRERGFHCLSPWNGSHPQVVRRVKAGLRDPASFEHIETRVTPANGDGVHRFVMSFRAKNGFGGMNIEQATGTYRQDDCARVVIETAP